MKKQRDSFTNRAIKIDIACWHKKEYRCDWKEVNRKMITIYSKSYWNFFKNFYQFSKSFAWSLSSGFNTNMIPCVSFWIAGQQFSNLNGENNLHITKKKNIYFRLYFVWIFSSSIWHFVRIWFLKLRKTYFWKV